MSKIVKKKLVFSFYNRDWKMGDIGRDLHSLCSEEIYSMPESGWKLNEYSDVIDEVEISENCFLFEMTKPDSLVFDIYFSDRDSRELEEKLQTLRRTKEKIEKFFKRMDKMAVMI